MVRKRAGLSFEGAASPEKSVIGEVFLEGLDSQVRVWHESLPWDCTDGTPAALAYLGEVRRRAPHDVSISGWIPHNYRLAHAAQPARS